MQKMGLSPQTVLINEAKIFDQNRAPVEKARLGKDEHGNPAWFIENVNQPGEFYLVEQ